MIIWRKQRQFRCIYVAVILLVYTLLACSEEVGRDLETILNSSGTDDDIAEHETALVESDLRFPTISSFFDWLGSFKLTESECKSSFEAISEDVPTERDMMAHVITMRAYSSVLQCLGMMGDLASTYKLSVSSSDTEMFSEALDISVDTLIKECLIQCKQLLLELYVKVHVSAFESEKTYSPALLKASERIMELYYTIWGIITLILGYTSMLQQSMSLTLKSLSETREKLDVLGSKKELSELEQLESNIYGRRLTDLERKKTLLELLLSILEGDFSQTVKAAEMESLLVSENKRSMSELDSSISLIGDSAKCVKDGKESINMQMVALLKAELGSRTQELFLQNSGSPIYTPLFDSKLKSIFDKFSLDGSEDHPSIEERSEGAETKQTSQLESSDKQ
ncbi:putative signal peptide-containing protein [Cryptosporidium canis]|uniref:Signal peptide-containing protein n=1 Tax=Cryptosporidium canis TaxID=195482 RepID=A0ABQ8P6N1_9CRYT|nr:putative signal peptide-containing protein [Cryptosporidium canis]KAJ1608236.1 putative signal peptide-containing protein [Cryptosporidium canis]